MLVQLWYGPVALLAVIVQSTLFPLLLRPDWRPNLIILLVAYASLYERLTSAIVIALLLGAIQDSLSGSCLGLHMFVYLTIVFLVHAVSEPLNVESPALFLLLVPVITLLRDLLAGALLTLFAETDAFLYILFPALPQHLLINFLFTFLALLLIKLVLLLFFANPSLSRLFRVRKLYVV